LSLVLAVVALLGFWIVEVVPLALGAAAWWTVSPVRQRGRGLGLWAMAIALCFGSCSFFAYSEFHQRARDLGAGVLSALHGKEESRLDEWLRPEKAEETAAALRRRYAEVVAAVGPYAGSLESGSLLSAAVSLFQPPSGVAEIGASDSPGVVPPATLWLRARFEKETLFVAVVLRTGGQEELKQAIMDLGGDLRRIVADVRFFRSAPPGGGG
jgi:hypothetical protein